MFLVKEFVFLRAEMVGDWNFKKQALGLEIAQKISSCGIDENGRAFLLELKAGQESEAFKKQVLSDFLMAVVQSKRTFSEDEKAFLFCYLEDFFKQEDFSVSDRLLALLVGDKDTERNGYIADLIQTREKNDGFFEETAAKLVALQPDLCEELTDRALILCQVGDKPKGVVFALALLEQNQIKLSIKLLCELAKKGAATSALMYLGRILACAKGMEKVLADMFLMNLSRLSEIDVFVLGEYCAELYLLGAKSFYDSGFYEEAGRILDAKRLALLIGDNARLKEKYNRLCKEFVYKEKNPYDTLCQETVFSYPQEEEKSVEKDGDNSAVGSQVSSFDVVLDDAGQETSLPSFDEPVLNDTKQETSLPSFEEPVLNDEKQETSLPSFDEPVLNDEKQKNVLSISSDVLKITAEEVEQHFEKIKRLSKEAFARAETRAKKHAGNISTFNIKKLVKKMPFSHQDKKD